MDNNTKKKDSVFSRLLVSTPMVAGTGFAIGKAFSGGVTGPQQSSNFRSAINAASVGTASSSMNLDFVRKYSQFFRTEQGAEIARQAWINAVSAADPRAKETLSFIKDMSSMPGAEVASSIEQTVIKSNSLFIQSVFQKFKSNVRSFEKQLQFGGLPSLKSISTPTFPAARNMAINQLPSELQAPFKRITSTLGAFGSIEFHSRPGWEEQGLGQYGFRFAFGGKRIDLNVPYAQGGILAEGINQSSRRIAPDVMLFDPRSKQVVSTMKRHEFLLRNFEESVIPDILSGKLSTQYDINKAVKQLYQEDIFSLESIPNVPHGVSNKGWESYQRIGGQAVDIKVFDPTQQPRAGDIFKSKFRAPMEEEFGAAMTATGLFPSTSPSNIAQGRLSRFNPSEWFMNPLAVDFARRPAQARREWRATHNAVQEMIKSNKSRWSIFETQAWRQDMGPYAAPHFRTLYVDPNKHFNLLQNIGMGEGESILAKTPSNQLQSEVYRVAPALHLSKPIENLQEMISSGHQFKPGQLLGLDVEGLPVEYKTGMRLKKLEMQSSKSRGDYADLFYEEFHKMSENEKKFKDIKAMERFTTNPFGIDRQIESVEKNKLFTGNIERWVSMDELKKDHAKHSNSMITAMWDVLERTKQRDSVARNKRVNSFMRNPTVFASYMGKKSIVGGSYSHQAFTQNLMNFAIHQGGFSPEEFGYAFGSSEFVLGKQAIQGFGLPNEFAAAASSGFAGGISQAVFGGHIHSGGLGSLEPRAFELLQGGQYGSLGTDISNELSARLGSSQPEKLAAYSALTRTLESVAGRTGAGISDAIWDVSKQGYSAAGFQEFIDKGGGFLKVGKGMSDIFIPGGTTIGMNPYMTASGTVTRGALTDPFHDIAVEAARLYSDVERTNLTDFRSSLSGFTSIIAREQAPGGKGAGSILRGSLEGSRFLTAVTQSGEFKVTAPRTVGIPESYAASMFNEMGESAEAIALRERAMAGESFAGLIARHPFTGPYSLQPINMQVIKGMKDPVMLIPSTFAEVQMANELPRAIQLNPMVGLSGDYDGDTVSAIMVSPSLEKKMRQGFTQADNEYTRAYMEHNIRAQLIKAKSAGGTSAALSATDNTIASALKLGTAESWVPKMSVALSSARSAIGSQLKGQEAANAAFTLDLLERIPISGKHLNPEGVLSGEMSGLFEQISSSITDRSSPRLQSAINNMLAQSDELSRSLLTQDIAITSGQDAIKAATGISVGQTLPGINLDNTVNSIMGALDASQKSGTSRMSKLLAGRASMGIGEISQYVDLLKNNTGRNISSAMLTARNLLGSIGESIIQNKKTVGYGFAGSIALATLLSSPKDTIGPGSQYSDVNMNPGRSKDRMKPETMMPPEQGLGNPTVSSQIPRPTIRMTSATHVDIRGSSDNESNNNNLAQQLGRMTGRSSSVNINIRDNRKSLNPDSVLNKVFS